MNLLIAGVSLFVNGFGVYLTMHASIGAAPWDVFNLGLSKTLGIIYGTASISVSVLVIVIDILLKEPIGLAMLLDAVVVGKSVDFFNWLDIVPVPKTLVGGLIMGVIGLVIVGYTQGTYMMAALGCGPRDTLLVGLKKRTKKIPIGIVGVMLQSFVTLVGYLLGGPVGVGTLLYAFGAGPIMQFAFWTMQFDATGIRHQNILESVKVMTKRKEKQ